ncbi:uncharacterized protein LOC132061171 [Lycium ferocissimum]|uniref:uncharacterized protein LOC132061171 n=1 Tax=Lycium ferocissimum TaxID=112874 RepID=UPI0028158C25|nr:uncharacterized protein LOC132061171 [Lycium ferocissimum]
MVDVLKTHPSSCPPRPLRSDLNSRDQTLWCEFHGTHGHKTTDCRQLREEVANMLAWGHLREYLSERGRNNYGRANPAEEMDAPNAPPHVINIIFGGAMIAGTSFITSRKMKNLVTREKRTRELPDDDTITFSDEVAVGVTLPHNDALVITVLIESCQVKRVMVDPGSFANILRWKVVEEMVLLEKMIYRARRFPGSIWPVRSPRARLTCP